LFAVRCKRIFDGMSKRAWKRLKRTEPQPEIRTCDWPGCTGAGEYRAPKARDRLREYHWFCLDHVREYNRSWDYFAGMTPGQIERLTRSDVTWRRPSWRLGGRGAGAPHNPFANAEDVFELFEEGGEASRYGGAEGAMIAQRLTPEQRQAVETLDVKLPLDQDALKAKYKELVKRHHPDANGGDKTAEERLKQVNDAYRTLRGCLEQLS
jgi:hypothetical protein